MVLPTVPIQAATPINPAVPLQAPLAPRPVLQQQQPQPQAEVSIVAPIRETPQFDKLKKVEDKRIPDVSAPKRRKDEHGAPGSTGEGGPTETLVAAPHATVATSSTIAPAALLPTMPHPHPAAAVPIHDMATEQLVRMYQGQINQLAGRIKGLEDRLTNVEGAVLRNGDQLSMLSTKKRKKTDNSDNATELDKIGRNFGFALRDAFLKSRDRYAILLASATLIGCIKQADPEMGEVAVTFKLLRKVGDKKNLTDYSSVFTRLDPTINLGGSESNAIPRLLMDYVPGVLPFPAGSPPVERLSDKNTSFIGSVIDFLKVRENEVNLTHLSAFYSEANKEVVTVGAKNPLILTFLKLRANCVVDLSRSVYTLNGIDYQFSDLIARSPMGSTDAVISTMKQNFLDDFMPAARRLYAGYNAQVAALPAGEQ